MTQELQQTRTPTPEDSATTTPGNSTAGSGDGGGGVVPEFPTGWDLMENALAGFAESLANGVASLVDIFNRSMMTLPAPGTMSEPSTWAMDAAHNDYWAAVAIVYAMLSAFVLPLVWGVGWFNVALPRDRRRRDRLKKLATTFLLLVAGWFFLAFWFHFWNEAALTFAPSGDEFMSTPGSASKLGVGAVLGVVLIVYNAAAVGAGLIMHLVFVFLTYVFVALWPLSVALWATDNFVVEPMGYTGIMGTLLLAPLQFVKAVILRLVYEFPLDHANPETVMTFILIAVGVTIAFLVVPYYGLKALLPHSIIASGGRITGGGGRGGQRVEQLKERAPSRAELKQRVSGVRADGGSRLGGREGSSGSALQSRSRGGSGSVISTARTRKRLRTERDTRSRSVSTKDRISERVNRGD